jgi:hypothetical protein
MKPIIKFNGGRGALLCNTCGATIKENLTDEEFLGKTNLLLCDKCKNFIGNSNFIKTSYILKETSKRNYKGKEKIYNPGINTEKIYTSILGEKYEITITKVYDK